MKVVLKNVKPRAKWLNDILMSRKSAVHSSSRHPSRSKQKQLDRKQVQDGS